MQSDSETGALVEKWLDGDSDACDELYRHYRPRVYWFAAFRLRVAGIPNWRVDADDAADDVFLKILNSRQTFKKDYVSAFEPWLFRIAANVVVDYIRCKTRRAPHLELDATLSSAAEDGPSLGDVTPSGELNPEQICREVEFLTALSDCIQHMRASHRTYYETLLLAYHDDQSRSEIAQHLRIKPAAANNQQHRALDFIQRELGRRGIPFTRGSNERWRTDFGNALDEIFGDPPSVAIPKGGSRGD